MKNGGLSLMVYGKYGRMGIYQIQDLLRIINKNEKTMLEELPNAKAVLKILPEYHKFNHIPVNEHKIMGNIGIFDLLLHKRDVSYSITDLYGWLRYSNLYFIDFTETHVRIDQSLKLRITEKSLYEKLIKMSIVEQRSIAEVIVGRQLKHQFYASKLGNPEASIEMLDNVIFTHGVPLGFRNTISDPDSYVQLRNKTYIYAKINGATTFAWPLNEFTNFAIVSLTRVLS